MGKPGRFQVGFHPEKQFRYYSYGCIYPVQPKNYLLLLRRTPEAKAVQRNTPQSV